MKHSIHFINSWTHGGVGRISAIEHLLMVQLVMGSVLLGGPIFIPPSTPQLVTKAEICTILSVG